MRRRNGSVNTPERYKLFIRQRSMSDAIQSFITVSVFHPGGCGIRFFSNFAPVCAVSGQRLGGPDMDGCGMKKNSIFASRRFRLECMQQHQFSAGCIITQKDRIICT